MPRNSSRYRWPLFAPIALVSAFSAKSAPALPDEIVFDASIGIATDYVFRGVSQTMGSGAVEAYAEASMASGLYAYVWGSNVDFMPRDEADDGVNHEIDLAVGYATDLTDRWSIDLAWVRYTFQGEDDRVDYDYDELAATVWFDEKYSATVTIADDVDGTDAQAVYYELGAVLDLPSDLILDVDFGHFDLSGAYGSGYSYLQTSLVKPIDNKSIALTWVDTIGDADRIFYRQTIGTRIVLSFRVGL